MTPCAPVPIPRSWLDDAVTARVGVLGSSTNNPTRPSSTMSSPSNSRNSARSVFSLNPSASAHRPFLNILNPMARSRDYKGYIQANQSVLEEAEEDHVDNTSVFALQSSPRQGAQRELAPQSNSPGSGWRSHDAPATNLLRPNIQEEDRNHLRPDPSDSSDDEVPQSFMIEASSSKPRSKSSKTKEKAKDKERSQKPSRPPLLSRGESARPILPTTTQDFKAIYATPPPRPLEVDLSDQFPNVHSGSSQPKQFRGLDAYERALWNWVNVCNLDAFLQEVYHYYQGKGIYCIALSRGLNLLSVPSLLLTTRASHTFSPAQWDLSLVFPRSFWDALNIRESDQSISPGCLT